MSDFYLRYNFVAVTGKVNGKDTTSKTFTAHGVRHDLWQEDRHTGKLTIKITTETPMIVGNKHTGSDPTNIEQYKWREKIAIPANTLKGMISSIAETLSQSTLRVLDDKYKPAFKKINGNTNLSPWRGDREGLTPAELLFGVVDDGAETTDKKQSFNLKSRLIFTDALPEKAVQVTTTAYVLKTQGTPRADSELNKDKQGNEKPAKLKSTEAYSLYFKNENGEGITHEIVNNHFQNIGEKIELKPHGRKTYLLHKSTSVTSKNHEKEENQNEENKAKCQLIKTGSTFFFDINFHNLTAAELSLLKQSIRPHKSYRHSIGLGKPFGLGIAELEIENTTIKDLKQRYAPTTNAQENKQIIEDDYSLIDKESRNILIHLRNIDTAPNSENIRERHGHLAENDANEASKPIQPPANVKNYPYGLGDSEMAQWLKQEITRISEPNGGGNYKNLPEDKLESLLDANALRNAYNRLADDDFKKQLGKYLCTLLELRDLDYAAAKECFGCEIKVKPIANLASYFKNKFTL